LALPLLAGLIGPAPHLQAAITSPDSITGLQVSAAVFDPTLHHNIENLTVSAGGQTGTANFLDYYNQTGGVTRWGYPTSEAFQEEPGNLTQYYQRGVVDWHWRADLNTYVLDRRLAWDYFGGDRAGGGNDQGTEPGTANPNGGEQVGPWGHVVSNTAVDGTPTGFQDFFDKLGGVQSFGYPKTEARVDTNASGSLHIPGATPGFIRQYFQGAVLEYHPDSAADPVQLRLLGDDLRNKNYPNDSWQTLGPFHSAAPASSGEELGLESLPAPAFQVIMPAAVTQGHTFQLKVIAPASDDVTATVDGKRLALLGQNGIWLGFRGFDPAAPVTTHTVAVADDGQSTTRTFEVTKVPWLTERIDTTPQENALSSDAVIAAENNYLWDNITNAYTPQQLWSGTFAYPLKSVFLTDGFGVFRSYNGGPANTYHEGRDLRAAIGTPIYASAAGRVVLARGLTERGNAVIIDHGLGVFTGYYHQSHISVTEGQLVNKGGLIGFSGQTGFADGPHVHWEVRVNNVYVDPDEWTRVQFGLCNPQVSGACVSDSTAFNGSDVAHVDKGI